MPENKHLRFFIVIAYAAIVYFALVHLLPQLVSLFLPFVIALIIALMCQPLVNLLNKRLKIPRSVSSLLSLLTVISVLTLILSIVVDRLIFELNNLIENLPLYIEQLQLHIDYMSEQFHSLYSMLPIEVTDTIDLASSKIVDTILGTIPSVTSWTLRNATTMASKMPNALIFVITFLLACYFLTSDFEKIKGSFAKQIPEKWHPKLEQIKEYILIAFGRYCRGVLMIMLITFTILLTGLLFAGIRYALLFALVIAVFDALPIVGTGTIIIPWSIVTMISGDIRCGLLLLLTYAVVLVTRSMVEPKVIGVSLGMPPILTLFSMYVGFRLFGFLGMILMPIMLVVIIFIQRAGIINIWKE